MPIAAPDLTYQEVVDSPDDFIRDQNQEDEKSIFTRFIWKNRSLIKLFVFLHLKLDSGAGFTFYIPNPDLWEYGRFNISFPIEVREFNDNINVAVWFRIPIPYALGEDENPGNVEEKVRIEAGSRLWMRENCPTVPLPHLYGFGFADDRHFTHTEPEAQEQDEEDAQFSHSFQLILAERFAERRLTQYVRNGKFKAPFSYLIYHYGPGVKLTTKMDANVDPDLYKNLFFSISNILLAMASVPQEKIGSYSFQDDGTIALTGRPHFAAFTQLEAAGIEPAINRGDTYNNTEAFFGDLIRSQRNRLIDYRNAVRNEQDAKEQLGAIAVLRSIANRFIKPKLRKGPFVMQMTELDMNHFVVNDNWNIVSLLELDFMASLPVEMFQEPHWMTGRLVDMDCEDFYTQCEMRGTFLEVFRPMEEAAKPLQDYDICLHNLMQQQHMSGASWFWDSAISLNGVSDFVRRNSSHMSFPAEGPGLFDLAYKFWGPDADDLITRKLADRSDYLQKLRSWFRARDCYSSYMVRGGREKQPATAEPSSSSQTQGTEDGGQQVVVTSSSTCSMEMEICEEDNCSNDPKQ
ncbi:hypothetical protein BGZ63DRAFT_401282 [Mariannaea sp. PMI_226]|nr:hypothetical protein BGZ63DRAFT_401282 [Mariannaea sp. PMI_226]